MLYQSLPTTWSCGDPAWMYAGPQWCHNHNVTHVYRCRHDMAGCTYKCICTMLVAGRLWPFMCMYLQQRCITHVVTTFTPIPQLHHFEDHAETGAFLLSTIHNIASAEPSVPAAGADGGRGAGAPHKRGKQYWNSVLILIKRCQMFFYFVRLFIEVVLILWIHSLLLLLSRMSEALWTLKTVASFVVAIMKSWPDF